MKTPEALAALTALAQGTRLAIFRKLVGAGPEGLTAGRIGAAVKAAPATLSFHLKELSRAGLVVASQEGRYVRYTASFEAMTELIDYLSAHCCGGDPAACQPTRSAS
jgi:ArsR family transcriptional regulator, arsenate/arsenite/antimonite-responsive transcriptional repressor